MPSKKPLTCLSLQLLKYSWAIDDAAQTQFSWTHETQEHMFAVFDSFRANEHQLKIHRNHEILLTVDIVKEVKKANTVLKFAAQNRIELLENQIPTIAMFRRTDLLIAMRYATDGNQITRFQLKFGSLKEFDEALERLKVLQCPLVDKSKQYAPSRSSLPPTGSVPTPGSGISTGPSARLPSTPHSIGSGGLISGAAVISTAAAETLGSTPLPSSAHGFSQQGSCYQGFSNGAVGTSATVMEESLTQANHGVGRPMATPVVNFGLIQERPHPEATVVDTAAIRPSTASTAPLPIANHLPPVRQLPHHRPLSSLSRPSLVENLTELRRPSYAAEAREGNHPSQRATTQPISGMASKKRKLDSGTAPNVPTTGLHPTGEAGSSSVPGSVQAGSNAAGTTRSYAVPSNRPSVNLTTASSSPISAMRQATFLTESPSTHGGSSDTLRQEPTALGHGPNDTSQMGGTLFDLDAQMAASLRAYSQLDAGDRRVRVNEMLARMILNDDFVALMKDLEGCVHRWGFDVDRSWGPGRSE